MSDHLSKDRSGGAFDALLAILRHKLVLATCLGLGVVGSYYYTLEQPIVYESRAQVLIVSRDRGDAMQAVNARQGFEDSAVSQAILARSERILADAVRTGHLDELASLSPHSEPALLLGSQLQVHQARLDDRSSADDILEFKYQSRHRDDCPVILRAVLAAYEAFLSETRANFANEVRDIISDARTSVQERLDQINSEYREFRRNSPLVWQDGVARNSHEPVMLAIEQQLADIRVQRLEREAEIKRIDDARRHGVGNEVLLVALEQMVDDDEVRTLEEVQQKARMTMEVFGLLTEYDSMKEVYGSDHPRLKAIASKIKMARQHFPEFFARQGPNKTPTEYLVNIYRQSIDETRQTLWEKEQQLLQSYEEEQSLAKEQLEHEMKNQEYLAEIARTQTLFDSLVERLEKIDALPDAGGISTATILEPTHAYQVKPVMRLNLFLGGIAGLMLGSLLGLLIEWANDEYVSVEDVQRQLEAPVLGLIPFCKPRRAWFTWSRSSVHPELWVYHRPGTTASDAVRRIRAGLTAQRKRNADTGLAVVVTSADTDDGKTTISANVAVALAKANRRVILVDCDLHRRRVARLFKKKNEVGVTSILAQGVDPPEAVVRIEELPNLDLLQAGPRAESAAELLSTSGFAHLIQWLRDHYEFVIVDSPPVFAVADTISMAPHVDGVLLVMRLTSKARSVTTRACHLIREAGGQLVGVAVNHCDQRRKRFKTIQNEAYSYGGYAYDRYRLDRKRASNNGSKNSTRSKPRVN